MSDWTAAGLDRIGSADEPVVTTRWADGSLRPYVPIWLVRAGGELFVRSWRGAGGRLVSARAAMDERRVIKTLLRP